MSKRTMLLMLSVIAALVVGSQVAAFASHPEASLAGSNFEIDEDANLKVDDAAPSIDWASVNETRAPDKVNGTGDDSYAGGVKEDTTCPSATTDSIPPNKSDLLSFSVYREPGSGTHPGFLNLAWSRVNNPSGTTLMDFEFNQSDTKCASGPNVVRTAGDKLIEYSIDQGGARATMTIRTWTGSAWGPAQPISTPSQTCVVNNQPAPCAAGTINSSTIPAADSDGLISTGEMAARTFGEAQIDLRLLFQPNKCASFGSAMLKSRSSDSFTSQLKDFVAPVGIDLQNCGNVIIRKQTIPDEDPNTTSFGYTKNFNTDPPTPNTFQLTDDGVKNFNDDVLFGSGYTVTEDVIPPNWDFTNLDCSASSAGVTPSINGATVTFAIDDAADVLDCTYTNTRELGAIKLHKDRKHAADGPGDHPHAGVDFAITGNGVDETVTTDADGDACLDGLAFGDYTVTEDVPAGYSANPTSDDVTVGANSDCGDGNEAVAGPFLNTPLTNVTVSVDSQVDGGTASTIDCDGETAETDANGDGSLSLENLEPSTVTCTIVIDP